MPATLQHLARRSQVLALLLFSCFSSCSIIIRRSPRPAEHNVLANCEDGSGVLSSQMAYWNGSPNSDPSAIAYVSTMKGQTAVWEGGAPISATFADGDVFSADIPTANIPPGGFAGMGKNDYVTFTCWARYFPNLYTVSGVTCSGIYDCDHEPLPGTTISTTNDPSPNLGNAASPQTTNNIQTPSPVSPPRNSAGSINGNTQISPDPTITQNAANKTNSNTPTSPNQMITQTSSSRTDASPLPSIEMRSSSSTKTSQTSLTTSPAQTSANTTNTAPSSESTTPPSKNSVLDGLNTGALIGTLVGTVLAAGSLGFAIYLYCTGKKKRQRERESEGGTVTTDAPHSRAKSVLNWIIGIAEP